MARLVRFRDRQCRFPGCAISSRFCDLDHVIPWPDGPTSPANLIALCRRHHRLKQSPGWTVAIHPDRTVTWTDPIGRTHTSYPRDHLGIADDWRSLPSADSTGPNRNAEAPRPAPAVPCEMPPMPGETADAHLSPLEAHLTRLLAA